MESKKGPCNCYFIGDFISNSGPANANRQLLNALSKYATCSFSKAFSKLARIFELAINIPKNNVCIICSASRINYQVIKVCKIFNKPIVMIIHGTKSEEYKCSKGDSFVGDAGYAAALKFEKDMYSSANRVVCVSEMFMNDMKVSFPEFSDKFCFVNNIVPKIDQAICANRHSRTIISTGGGIRQKNNLSVAKAISKINSEQEDQVEFIVIGKEELDGAEIKKFDFVTYYDYLPHDEVIKLMNCSSLYIQNSIYDSFGLAVIEALYSGTSILISKNVGCKTVFEDLKGGDLIEDVNNIGEISQKILHLLNEGNNQRLRLLLKKSEITEDYVGEKLFKEIEFVMK